MGYKNLEKKLEFQNNKLSFDQLFCDKNTIFLIEQKIRDDHDSTKKRGQYANFINKIRAIKNTYKNKKIDLTEILAITHATLTFIFMVIALFS